MSSRALRKLRKDDDLSVLQDNFKSSEDEDLSSHCTVKTPSFNVFDLLDGASSQSDNNDGIDKKNTEADVPKAKLSNGAKKKKRKKKTKNQCKDQHDDSNCEDIDKILSELDGNKGSVCPNSVVLSENSTPSSIKIQSSLVVVRRHLNAESEMRRMFGNDVMGTENHQSTSRRKKCIFATAKANWPPMKRCGVQMVLDKTENGISFFKYVHSKTNYQNLQQMFWKASHSADPHAVRQVLEIHPYHIDTLLHLSEVCRVSEDTQTASDLLNRALFCLEKAMHPNFNVTSVSCQIDYNRRENRALFVAIFRQILFASMKSCWKSSYELCKLLYNLSPQQDPFACLLIMDTLALKVENFDFVLEFIDEFDHALNLTLLPNFAYSHALALFYKEVMSNTSHEKSAATIRSAVLRYPMIAQLICEKFNYNLESNSLYVTKESTIKSHTRSLTQQCKLYVERASELWTDSEVVSWFKKNVTIVNNEHEKIPGYAKALSNRKQLFLSPPLNVMRHIFISDISSVSALLPPAAFERSQDPHDPMPPSNSYADYSPETRQMQARNPVLAFIDSLMPGFVNNQGGQEAVQGVELGGFLHPTGEENQAGHWGEQVRNIPGDFGAVLRDMLANLYIQNNEPIPEVLDETEMRGSDSDQPENDLD